MCGLTLAGGSVMHLNALRLAKPIVALLLLISWTAVAQAVIKKLTPLKEVIDVEELIFIAKVDKVDPEKPSTIFTFEENLKGKAPFERLPVNLTGDAEAKRDNQLKMMLERLAPGRKMVIFASKQGKDYSAFVYLEGTWFQMKGNVDAETKAVRWAFLHGEPYFRRTFSSSTAELVQVIQDARSGKKAPPAPDEKAMPGYGPKAEDDKPPEPKKPLASRYTGGPLFGVIPSFVLLGPLAILAAFFPGVFARLAVGMTRWRAFLIVASTNSTLAIAYYFFRGYLPDHWAFGPTGFNLFLVMLNLLGLVWSGYRHRNMASEEPEITDTPQFKDLRNLLGITLAIGLLVFGTAWLAGWTEALQPVGYKSPTGQEASGMGHAFTGVAIGLVVAAVYWLYRRIAHSNLASSPQLCIAGETAALVGMLLFTATIQILNLQKVSTPPGSTTVESTKAEIKLVYESADFSEVMSPITILENKLIFGVTKLSGFRQSGGIVCLDRNSFEEQWRFNDDGAMKPVFGQVAVDNGKVYTGEGLHTDSDRRLFCLAAADGKPVWAMPASTTSHTEGSPVVVDGKVYFSAGDDGLYCVNASDGKLVWQLKGQEEKLHIDNPVVVTQGKVFAGSGYKSLCVFAADASTGKLAWKTPVPLRSFGAPLVLNNRVIYGLGTGNLAEDLNAEADGTPSETKPAGMVICLDSATGKALWQYELAKSVHTSLEADGRSIYATCKDGTVHAINLFTGAKRWSTDLGGTLTTGPLLIRDQGVPLALYVVSQQGIVFSLSLSDGSIRWRQDLRESTGRDVSVLSTPKCSTTGSKQIFFGAMLENRNTGNKSAGIFKLTDQLLE
jgi:outer membrane protein assembly factor BamB